MKRPNYRRRRRGVYVHPLVKLLILLAAAGSAFVCVRYYGRLPGETHAGDSAPVQNAPVPEPLPKTITTPAGAACTLTQLGPEAVHTGNLILVNNWTAFHFPEHQEESLACILDQRTESYYVKDSTVLLLPEALQALNSLMDAFKSQGSRKSVQIVAGHRTTGYQQHLFDQSAERNGLEHAKKYVAQPGHSEHHTGLVVDMGTMNGEFMDSSGDYAWITENCQDYGWVVRYETGKEEQTGIWDEPWHFRYVGIPHATEMVRRDYCLEEYIDYLKQFPQDGEHLMIDCVSGQYEVWYTEGCEVYLPDSKLYTVSGNNVDGVIVTCRIGD